MEFNKTLALVTIGLLVVAGILFVTIPIFLASSVLSINGKNTSASLATVIGEFKNTTQTVLVHIIPERNTVLFNSHAANLVFLSVNEKQAQNLTSQNADGNPVTLIAGGLIFPTVDVQRNASVKIIFVNMVPDQSCNLVITTINPATVASSGVQISSQLGAVLSTPSLLPANLITGKVYQYTASLPTVSSDLWYSSSCTPSVSGMITTEGG